MDCCEDIIKACKNGHLICLQTFHANGVQLDPNSIDNCIVENKNEGHFECIKYIHQSIDENVFYISWLASLSIGIYGYLDIIKYFHENGHIFHSMATYSAAGSNHLDCLKFLHEENRCPWDNNTTYIAARHGYLESLKYAHENGAEWSDGVTKYAAWNGHLQCLKYAHENGCPWDKFTTRAASGCSYLMNGSPDKFKNTGDLECLKYAYENGCPWDEKTTEGASECGKLDCLIYAYKNGCPITKKVFDNLNNYYSLEENLDKLDLINNIELRQLLLDSTLKPYIEDHTLVLNKILEFNHYIQTMQQEFQENTGLPTDVIKYEIIKFI